MFRRQKFSKAGAVKTITKEAAKKKAAEKIKKIDKLDMDRLTKSFSQMKKILADLPENKKAKNIYDSSIKSIKARVTKGKSKEDKRDAMKAYERYAQTIFKGSKDPEKKYESLPDVRSRFRPEPGPKRKLVKGVTNPFKRNKILAEFRKKQDLEAGYKGPKKYKPKKFGNPRGDMP